MPLAPPPPLGASTCTGWWEVSYPSVNGAWKYEKNLCVSLRESGGRNLKQKWSCLQVEGGGAPASRASWIPTLSTRPKNRYNFWCATLIRVIHKALQRDVKPNKGSAVTFKYFSYRPLNGLSSQKAIASISQRFAAYAKVNFFFPSQFCGLLHFERTSG